MSEFLTAEETAGAKAPETEFFLATATAWSNAEGVQIKLDGQNQPMTKRFKMMYMCRPLKTNARVVVMKQSGTYIVLGEIGLPNSWQNLPDLASNASTTDIINKINAILAWMRTQGMLWTS